MNSQVGAGGAAAAVRAMRPRQWTKNLLVVAAPAAAGRLLDADVVVPSAVAFVCFCMASSAVYLLNDVNDREADRRHPVKSRRPIASGQLGVTPALVIAFLLVVGAMAAATAAGPELVLVTGGYLLLQVAYTLWLKHEAIVDLAAVALGFLLRAVAGGVAADIELSRWFLMVAGFGSLFMVAAKRHSEFASLGAESGTRRSLHRYSESYLRFVWSMAASATVLAYSLWAFETEAEGFPWRAVSVVPFVLGILRYGVGVDQGRAGEPEDVIFGDRILQLIGAGWLVTLALGVAHG